MKFLLIFLLCAVRAFSATYYADFATGLDSNTGTDKAHPWKHHPFMAGEQVNYVPVAGDLVILKGGVSWDHTCFPVANSGSVSIGVDPTWFSGPIWTRPKFDNGGVSSTPFIMGVSNATYDNIEFTGYTWSGPVAYGKLVMISLYGCTHTTVSNCYFHKWNHGAVAAGTQDNLYVILGSTAGTTTGNVIQGCLFDNADGMPDSGMASYCVPTIRNSTARNMANGFLINEAQQSVTGTNVGPINVSFDPLQHCNGIESMGSGAITTAITIDHCTIRDCKEVTVLIDPSSGTGGSWTTNFTNNQVSGGTNFLLYFLARSMGAVGIVNVSGNTFDTTGGVPGAITSGGSNYGRVTATNNIHLGTGPLLANMGATVVTETGTTSSLPAPPPTTVIAPSNARITIQVVPSGLQIQTTIP